MTRNTLSLAALVAVLSGELAQAQTRHDVDAEPSYVRQVSYTTRSQHYFSQGTDCGCDGGMPAAGLWDSYSCDSCPPCGTSCRSHTFPPVLSTVFHGLGNLFHRLGEIRPCRLSITTCCSSGGRRGFSRKGCATGCGDCGGCASHGSEMMGSPLQAVPSPAMPLRSMPAVDNPFKDEIAEPPLPPKDARYIPQRSRSAVRSRLTDKTRVSASIRSTARPVSAEISSDSPPTASKARLAEISVPMSGEPRMLEISTAEPIQLSGQELDDESEPEKPVRQTSGSARSGRRIPLNPLR